MNRPTALWLALALALPLLVAGCAHRADRPADTAAAAPAGGHAMHGAHDAHAMHGSHGAQDAHGMHGSNDAHAAHRSDGAQDAHGMHGAHGVDAADGDAGDSHAAHADHAVHGDNASSDADTAVPTERWPADAPLVRGMARIRTATDSLAHAAHGHLDPAQVQAIAAELKSAVETMFVECRLDPAPDAALHPLLARVLGASQRLSERGFDATAQDELRAVLARYGELFDEAGVISADHNDSA